MGPSHLLGSQRPDPRLIKRLEELLNQVPADAYFTALGSPHLPVVFVSSQGTMGEWKGRKKGPCRPSSGVLVAVLYLDLNLEKNRPKVVGPVVVDTC